MSARLPTAALEPFLAKHVADQNPSYGGNAHGTRIEFPAGLLALLGPNLATSWHRARRAGTLSPPLADKLANAIGLHPAEVWGMAWWHLGEGDRYEPVRAEARGR